MPAHLAGSVETDVVPDVDVEQLISEGRVPIQEILAAHGYRIAGQDEAVAASAEEDVKDDGSAQLKEAADSGAQGELGNQTDEEETAPPPGEESASRSRVMELLNGPLLPDEDSSGTESSEEEGQEEESPPTEKEYSGKGGEAEEPADGGADGTALDDAATGWTEPSEGVGVTSGTTSTVAILSANRVIVANSGDGRYVSMVVDFVVLRILQDVRSGVVVCLQCHADLRRRFTAAACCAVMAPTSICRWTTSRKTKWRLRTSCAVRSAPGVGLPGGADSHCLFGVDS